MLNKKKCLRKNMKQYRTTQTITLIQNYFGKNLTQYSIPTLIGVPHELFPHRLPGI